MRLNITRYFAILMLLCWLVSGCTSLRSSPSKAIDSADSHVTSADDHVAAATSHAQTAQAEVRTAIPLSPPAVVPHLKIADSHITQTITEDNAARADNAATQKDLATAKADAVALAADRDKWEGKYKGQWFAGKFWAAFWVVVISGSLILIGVLLLNFYTDLFVVPLAHLGKWAVDIIASTIKAAKNVIGGVWNELASLFKRKPSPPAPTGLSPTPTNVGAGSVSGVTP